MPDRKASARWEGDLRSGNGTIQLGSGAFEGKYSFGSRFEGGPGTNPEELLGAAHAACFTMALSSMLAKAGHPPTSVATTAVVHIEKGTDGFAITGIDLVTRGDVPGASEAEFQKWAHEAKSNCIVSRALSAVPMTVAATLVA